MKSLLFGNGININFSGSQFTNKAIIIRAITNIQSGKNPREAYTKEVLDWFKLIFTEYENTRNGSNDQYVFSTFERSALSDFKRTYANKNNPKIYDIGFEDFFLLHDVFCYKNKIENPNRYKFREVLRRMFLDSIYFSGKILRINKKFPNNFNAFLQDFDYLFTTNYDNNVELFSGKPVLYLHGAFHEIDEKYNPANLRNHFSDMKDQNFDYTKKHPYLFSTALSTFSGEVKEYSMTQHELANSALSKFQTGYQKGEKIREEIDKWESNGNELVRNLYDAIKLKMGDPEFKPKENYPLQEFKNISDELVILGLSPYNDTHIFKWIKENKKISQVTYFYFEEHEKNRVQDLVEEDRLIELSAKEFWDRMGT